MRALLVGVALSLALCATARAATYEVSACAGGGGSGVNHLFVPSGDAGGCVAGSGLYTRSYPMLAPLSRSAQVMTAPEGTTIAGYSLRWAVRWASPTDGGYAAFVDGGDDSLLDVPCTWIGCVPELPATGPTGGGWAGSEGHGLSRGALRLATQCGGAWCTTGYADAAWSDIRVELADGSAPAVTAGRLDGWVTGEQPLSYSATDNSGIRRARLYLDGELASEDARACDYSHLVPCAAAAGSFVVDPSKLSDGTHSFEVKALDATDANSGTSGSTSFLVDTHAPVMTAAGQGSPGAWQPGPVTVTLSASDPASGVSHIDYSLDGGDQHNVTGERADVQVAGDGTHTLSFTAHDVAGNISAERAVTIGIGTPADRLGGHGPGFWDHAANPGSTFTAASSFE